MRLSWQKMPDGNYVLYRIAGYKGKDRQELGRIWPLRGGSFGAVVRKNLSLGIDAAQQWTVDTVPLAKITVRDYIEKCLALQEMEKHD